MGFLRRYRDVIVVGLVLLVPLVYYLSSAKDPKDHNFFDRAVLTVSAPVQALVVAAIDGIVDTWDSYFALVAAKEDNARLQQQVAELEASLAGRDEEHLDNLRLRELLGLRNRAPFARTVTAEVIATSPSPLFRSLRLDRGSDDGLNLGDAVVDPKGVVGRIAAIGSDYADVMLVVDANSSLDILIQRTRSRARVRGQGGDNNFNLDVEHLGRTVDLEPGDVLVTSGLGSVFPKGLVVGVVTAVTRGKFGLYQTAEVEPRVDFRRLEGVLVIPAGWPADTNFESVADMHAGRIPVPTNVAKPDGLPKGGSNATTTIKALREGPVPAAPAAILQTADEPAETGAAERVPAQGAD